MRKQRRRSASRFSFAVPAKLISAFVFAIRIVQFLYYLNPKFQASSHILWLYSLVCVGPGRKPRRPVFSERGSNDADQRLCFRPNVACYHFWGVTPKRFKCTWFRRGILDFSLECITLLQNYFFKQGYIPLNVTIPGRDRIDPNTHLCRTFFTGYNILYTFMFSPWLKKIKNYDNTPMRLQWDLAKHTHFNLHKWVSMF